MATAKCRTKGLKDSRSIFERKSDLPSQPGGAAASEAQVPQALVPQALIPQALVPQALVPQALVPQALIPQAQVPQAQVPQALIPQALIPQALVPQLSSWPNRGTRVTVDVQSGISVKVLVENLGGENAKMIYEMLPLQYPNLKETLEKMFPGTSYQEHMELRKENFGKIQQSFSEVYRVRMLLNLGKSVCKVIVQGFCEGTGFVLFGDFILMNAHLFEKCKEGGKLQEHVNVFALFNYEDPEPETNYFYFSCKKTFVAFDLQLDYAVLELNPDGQKPNRNTKKLKLQVPPGLLKKFGPIPLDGEACLIGHAKGHVKQMDPTCIIVKDQREQAVCNYLRSLEKCPFVIQCMKQHLTNQGIEDIMVGGNKADLVMTYKVPLYHGASGSPVFDAHGQVFGLHTAGFTYGFPCNLNSVIEYGHPLLSIFESFVSQLREGGKYQLLERVKQEAKENRHLMKVLGPEPNGPDELMDTDEA